MVCVPRGLGVIGFGGVGISGDAGRTGEASAVARFPSDGIDDWVKADCWAAI